MRFAQGFERYSVSDVFEQAIGSRGRAKLINIADICQFKAQLISSHDADLLVYSSDPACHLKCVAYSPSTPMRRWNAAVMRTNDAVR